MSTENSDLKERIAALEKATEENGKTIWRVFEAVYGNGKPGMLTELQLLRRSVEAHHADDSKRSDTWKWAIMAIIAAGTLAVAWLK